MQPTHDTAPTVHDDDGARRPAVGHPSGHDQPAGEHGDTGGHGGHGDHVAMFRRRFWWSLLLTLPLVATSHMVMDWFGYDLDFPAMAWVGPVLGTIIFFWGGWPFLSGGWSEVRGRRPGMMLLIAMAITVAYVASLATSLGLVRPRLLVGAGGADHDHAAGPLAGDEGPRPGPVGPGRPGRAAARRGRAGPLRRRDRDGVDLGPRARRRRARAGRRAGAGRRRRSSTARPSSTSRW